ncbi:patronin isoform X3 [Halyomorpha halys]|uniref:patronin isoform X3 n=1 Tax=Halyomorpha halys TaxID=286706 RepID=UPI0006D4F1F4|nr:patronin isoform X3 [Halyomorpha halys]
MWGAISRIFYKKLDKFETSNEETIMDKGEGKRVQETDTETHATRQAKQRATVKWLLSKAYNNRVPENLREPFYRNHEDLEHLKPAVVHYLANAELYCMALSNIYSDPNYNNLNHWNILQALARKGVYISDPHITETVLIQTTPLKLSAHVTVMQGVMALYAREVATPELVSSAVKRFSPTVPPPAPNDHESALLYWVSQAVSSLCQRLAQENKQEKNHEFPALKDVTDLCDGACLAGLLAFYCPERVSSGDIKLSPVPTVSDCVRNLSLVADFCSSELPVNIFHMAPEELYYMRGSLKQNLVVFLADLFNMLEIHPAQCVTLNIATHNINNVEGRNNQGVAHKRSLPQAVSAIPDLRSGLDSRSSFSGSPILSSSGLKKVGSVQVENSTENKLENGNDEFVVHRGRGVPTLSSVISGDGGNKSTEPAGKPTNWEPRKPSYAGRRSRRNSLSDESQLTLENFGGSEENLHLLGRNPDKEPAVHSGRRESSARSSVLDNNSDALHHALQEGYSSKQAPEPPPRMSLSRNNSFIESQKRAEETRSSAGIQQTLLEPQPSSKDQKQQEREKKVTTFAALPNNTTTWQQQSLAHQASDHLDNGLGDTVDNGVMGSQLLNIRLKLEEKRRRIESEKRRMEAQMNRQRQKVGKAAFLQAVSKGKVVKSPDSDPGRGTIEVTEKPARPFSLQDISEVEQKWLTGDGFIEEQKTPDMENIDLETYQKSIAQMNSSLHEIQVDLQRLANQQNQLQSNQPNIQSQPLVQPSPPPQMQSFASLHHQQANYTSQHINFSSQHTTPTHNVNQPQLQHNTFNQQQTSQATYNTTQQPSQVTYNTTQQQPSQVTYNTTQQQPINYGNQPGTFTYNNQPQNNEHEYYNGRSFSGAQQQHQNQMQQMHSLMTGANNSQTNYSSNQQWHSLSQQTPPQTNYNTYSSRYNQGFTLHGNFDDSYNGRRESQTEFYLHEPQSSSGRRTWGQPFTPDPTTWGRREPVSLDSSPKQNGGELPVPPPRLNHAPLPTPPVDDMEPQSISFIGSGEDNEQLSSGLSKLNITSGNRTYRIPSPTRTARNSFQKTPNEKQEQGFYISFDEESAPKRPKPPLRAKRGSPKKERNLTQTVEPKLLSTAVDNINSVDETPLRPRVIHSPPGREERVPAPHDGAIVIGAHPDPNELDEMEKKKERILMMSLQRRQAAEEARNLKEAEAARRRDLEKAKEEEKIRKKEEEKRRRAAILERHKVKKAIEEAEREGKQVDKDLLNSLKASLPAANSSSAPKLRQKASGGGRPRPKTIHIDSGAEETGMMTPSRGKKGSSSNLSEVGDESRGTSPGRSLGRRSSYKTSRDGSPEVRTMTRPRVVPATRRKSNSLMNLAGSSCDQDSLAYRYTDTDSGLGRATPPRRVPSPSGPGSLPAGRRRPDDSLSDAGSDYNGPRLYRQPTTKSNKGIVLNAVEYCVFPGAVNREAKQRVIEEMNRSEAKHFLVLFRDSGCQFRALYAYWPDTEEVIKLYGTGPKQVTDRMFDKFFKYNSGGKCFSQVHTKHLTVTIDAFTIHNSLWQGKKVNLPNKRDMTLVI